MIVSRRRLATKDSLNDNTFPWLERVCCLLGLSAGIGSWKIDFNYKAIDRAGCTGDVPGKECTINGQEDASISRD